MLEISKQIQSVEIRFVPPKKQGPVKTPNKKYKKDPQFSLLIFFVI